MARQKLGATRTKLHRYDVIGYIALDNQKITEGSHERSQNTKAAGGHRLTPIHGYSACDCDTVGDVGDMADIEHPRTYSSLILESEKRVVEISGFSVAPIIIPTCRFNLVAVEVSM